MWCYDYETALAWVDKCLDANDDPDLLMIKGNLLFKSKQYSYTADIFGKLIQSDHEKGKPLIMLGYAA